MSVKIGRNEPCPCGSGKKYKNCRIGKPIPETRYGGPASDDELDSEDPPWDEQDRRIAAIPGFGGTLPRVSRRTLLTYCEYLVARLSPQCRVKGREDFPWEEYYVFGPGDPNEYARLKETRPSYKDEYRIIEILTRFNFHKDLTVSVDRIRDGKRFKRDLSWLEAVDPASPDWQLLDDFSYWQGNC